MIRDLHDKDSHKIRSLGPPENCRPQPSSFRRWSGPFIRSDEPVIISCSSTDPLAHPPIFDREVKDYSCFFTLPILPLHF